MGCNGIERDLMAIKYAKCLPKMSQMFTQKRIWGNKWGNEGSKLKKIKDLKQKEQ